jgi:hypothetical protein
VDLSSETKVNADFIDIVEAVFTLSQKAAETWLLKLERQRELVDFSV